MDNILMTVMENLIIGGGETYFLRLSCYLKNQGFKSQIIKIGYEDNSSTYQIFKVNGIEFLHIELGNDSGYMKSEIITEWRKSRIICITYSKQRYVFMKRLFRLYDLDASLFLYVISYANIMKENSGFFSRLINKLWVRELIDKGAYILMDDTKIVAENYFAFKKKQLRVMTLGENIHEEKERYENNSGKLRILTVSRFDFPFKGYVYGLMKDYMDNISSFPNSELNVIGDGEGMQQIRELLDKYPENKRKKIKLLGNIPYNQLEDYYRSCDLYFGMGTTLLEAAACKCCPVVVGAYQMDSLSIGYFCKVNLLGLPIGGYYSKYVNLGKGYKKASEYIKEIYNKSPEEILALGHDAYEVYTKKYDISNSSKYILNSNYGKISKPGVIRNIADNLIFQRYVRNCCRIR